MGRAGVAVAVLAAAADGEGTLTVAEHPGHFTARPAAASGAASVLPQEHRTRIGMAVVVDESGLMELFARQRRRNQNNSAIER